MRMVCIAIAAAALSGLAFPAAARAGGCSFLKAVYAPVDDAANAEERYRLRHIADPLNRDMAKREANAANYVLRLTVNRGKRPHYFGFAFPNGHAWTKLQYLGDRMQSPSLQSRSLQSRGVTVKPDVQTSSIMYFDAKMKIVNTDSDGAAVAPQFLIMPQIAGWFWYGDRAGRDFNPPEGLWRYAECLSSPRSRLSAPARAR